MSNYNKMGFLNYDFKMFHIVDTLKKEFQFHYHDFYKIIIFLQGNVTYSIEGRNYSLEPYDVILVNSGEIHRPIIDNDMTYERIIIYISPEFMNNYKDDNYDLSLCFKKTTEECSHVLRIDSLQKSKLYQVSSELERSFSDNSYASELYQKLLFLEFMIHLNRAVILNHITYIENSISNDKIIEIINYIKNNLDNEITIDTLADSFYINRYYLMHLFKQETGYTIGQYISDKRLLLAKQMLQNGCSVTESCYASGFKNYSTFLRAYKKAFKAIPKKCNNKTNT